MSPLTNLPNEVQISRDTDHRALCRFASSEDNCYIKLMGILNWVLKHGLVDREANTRKLAEEAKCLYMLDISAYEIQNDAAEKPAEGTCRWILDNPTYRS